MTVTLTTSLQVDEAIAATEGALLLEFGADWCPPCRAMEPVLDRLAADHAGSLTVRSVDVDAAPELARRFDVASVPTMVLLRDGDPLVRLVGARPERALLEALADHL